MKFLNAIDPVSMAAISEGAKNLSAIPLEIAKTISAITDAGKRRRFEQSVMLMSERQKNDLNEKLLAAQTQTDRLSILSGSVVDYAIANENKAARQEIALYVVAGSLAIVVISASIFYAVKMNK